MRTWMTLTIAAAALPLAAQLRISEICPKPTALDANGKESGWIELANTSATESVSLADYSLVRFNRGKEDKAESRKALPAVTLGAGERFVLYTSEMYPNAKDLGGDESVQSYQIGETDERMWVFPFKVNPKKYPNLRLYKGTALVDTFIVPVDLPEDWTFAPGEGEIREWLADASTPYRYRVAGETEWQEGAGRLEGVLDTEVSFVEGRIDVAPTPDSEAFAFGFSEDVASGLDAETLATLRSDAWDLSGNTEKNKGLTMPASVTEQLTGAYTLALWFRADDVSASAAGSEGRLLFDSRLGSGTTLQDGLDRSGMLISLDDDAQIQVQYRGSGGNTGKFKSDTTENYADGAWHHLVLAIGQQAGAPARLWIDGVKEVDATLACSAELHPTMPLCFGRAFNSGYWHPFDGQLADIRVYGRALSDAEAQAVYAETAESRNMTGERMLAGSVTQGEDGVYAFPGAAASTGAYVSASVDATLVAEGETLDLWINPSAYSSGNNASRNVVLMDARSTANSLAAKYPGYMLALTTSGGINFQRGSNNTGGGFESKDFQLPEAVPLNAWTHLTLTVDAATGAAVLYCNGVRCDEVAFSTDAATGYSPATVERRFCGSRDAWWGSYKGSLAAPSVYRGVLSAQEIAKLHNASALATEKVKAAGSSATAQTVVPMGEAYAAIEGELTIALPEAVAPENRLRIVAASAGALTATLDGEAVEPGALIPAPAAGEHVLAWRVEPAEDGVAAEIAVEYLRAVDGVTRVLLPNPTPGEENDLSGAVPYGPNIGPAVGVKDSSDGVTALRTPAPLGEDFPVTFEIHPFSETADNAIVSVNLLYRADFGEIKSLPMEKTGAYLWSAAIPAADLPAAGHLIRYAAQLTDGVGNAWRSPSFKNPSDGYEWFGTIMQPAEDQLSATLQTFHLFADAASLSLMDKQYDAISASNPLGGRVGVYDSQTGTYYDNVRIDLRGNTSAKFKKKSHSLRFSKCQPLTCTNPFTGEKIDGLRKTSFIAEYADPTCVRQALSFWLWRQAGNLVPYAYPVRLQLNGEFYQLANHSNRFSDELIEDYYGLDPYGYGYKSVGNLDTKLSTTGGGIEKKTPDDGNENDVSVLRTLVSAMNAAGVESGALENAALTKVAVERLDLPAWFNYLAAARITSESDDTGANICIYYDVNGTGTWMPLGYDHNLSFGQWWRGTSKQNGLRANRDDLKGHPLYGSLATTSSTKCNRAIETIFQHEKFRRLYLRRLRTLMDTFLKDEGTAPEDTPFWMFAVQMREALRADCALDIAKWRSQDASFFSSNILWVWPYELDLDGGFDNMWNDYVVPRRKHLFYTHSIHSAEQPYEESYIVDAATTIQSGGRAVGYGAAYSAGIPDAQSPVADLAPGFSFAGDTFVDGVSDSEKLVIRNANAETVDLSGWTLSGSAVWTLPAGTVIDADGGELVVVFDRKQYVADHAAELTDQILVGNATRVANATSVTLSDAEGNVVAKLNGIANTDSSVKDCLRVAEVMGNTADAGGDGDEYVVLRNLSDVETLNLAGCRLTAAKHGGSPKVDVTLGALELAPGATLTLAKADYAASGWEKITNGAVDMMLYDAAGELCQSLYLEFGWWAETKGGGAALVTRSDAAEITAQADWKPSFTYAGQYLRVAEIMGNTLDAGGDGAEYVILRNTSADKTLSLAGCRFTAAKSGDAVPKVDVVLGDLSLAPGETISLRRADYAASGWDKITNNKVDALLCDAFGNVAQTLYMEFKWYASTYGGGAALVALSDAASVTAQADWAPSFELPADDAGAAVQEAIAARPALAEWLGAVDAEALAAFAGTAEALDLCWLADIPPQDEPEVELSVATLAFDEYGNLVLDAALLVNGEEKAGKVNGAIVLETYTSLDAAPEETVLDAKAFPLSPACPLGDGKGFYRLRLR